MPGILCGPAERRLINNLLAYYQKLERPVVNESDAIQLRFGLTLQQIMNVVSLVSPGFRTTRTSGATSALSLVPPFVGDVSTHIVLYQFYCLMSVPTPNVSPQSHSLLLVLLPNVSPNTLCYSPHLMLVTEAKYRKVLSVKFMFVTAQLTCPTNGNLNCSGQTH